MLRALLCLALLVHVSVAAESTGNTATQIAAAKSQPSTTTPLLSAILANEDEEKEIVVGDIIAAKAALDAGANVNERNTTFNDTPLLRAAMLGQMQMVRLLLRHGADPNAKGADDWTPLMWAARNTKAGTEADIVLELLEAGASVLDRSKIGYTPLHVAASHGNLATLMTLVEGGAQVDATDSDGQTPLAVAAAAHSQSQLLRYLLRQGATVDALNDRKATALHWATFRGHIQNCKTLLRAGADPTLRDVSMWKPLEIAQQFGFTEIAAELEKAEKRWPETKKKIEQARRKKMKKAKRRAAKRLAAQSKSAAKAGSSKSSCAAGDHTCAAEKH